MLLTASLEQVTDPSPICLQGSTSGRHWSWSEHKWCSLNVCIRFFTFIWASTEISHWEDFLFLLIKVRTWSIKYFYPAAQLHHSPTHKPWEQEFLLHLQCLDLCIINTGCLIHFCGYWLSYLKDLIFKILLILQKKW